jgi:SAM-dependent methyltransferase
MLCRDVAPSGLMTFDLFGSRRGHRLRFTGTCDEREFAARCAKHDYWYHSFYFDNGFVQRGDYDIGLNIDEYGFPTDVRGMSVLDVGTGSGWFATYFEQRGAAVTTVDVRGYCDFDVYGRAENPSVTTEKSVPDRVLPDGRAVYYSPVSGGFWVMKDMLGLQAEYVNARIYELKPELFGGRTFDLVFVGALLMHLRDPIGALMAVRSVCRDRVIANSMRGWDEELPVPLMRLIAPDGDAITWWAPNRACLIRWFRGAGFRTVEAERTTSLTVDRAYVDQFGTSTAAAQKLYLVHASV